MTAPKREQGFYWVGLSSYADNGKPIIIWTIGHTDGLVWHLVGSEHDWSQFTLVVGERIPDRQEPAGDPKLPRELPDRDSGYTF